VQKILRSAFPLPSLTTNDHVKFLMLVKAKARRRPGSPSAPNWWRQARQPNKSICKSRQPPTLHLARLGTQMLQVQVLAPSHGQQAKTEMDFQRRPPLPLGRHRRLRHSLYILRRQIQSIKQSNILHHLAPARTRLFRIHPRRNLIRSPRHRLPIGETTLRNPLRFNITFNNPMYPHLRHQVGILPVQPQGPPNNINSSHPHHPPHQFHNTLTQAQYLLATLCLANLVGMHTTLRHHMARLMAARLRCMRSPRPM